MSSSEHLIVNFYAGGYSRNRITGHYGLFSLHWCLVSKSFCRA